MQYFFSIILSHGYCIFVCTTYVRLNTHQFLTRASTVGVANFSGCSFRGFLLVVLATDGDCGPEAAFWAAFLACFWAFLLFLDPRLA